MAQFRVLSPVSTLITVALILAAVLALTLTSRAGAKPPAPRAESFEGSCELSGAARHEPPLLAAAPVLTEVSGSFSGTCSGELTDSHGRARELNRAPADYRAQGSGELSCLGGVVTGHGRLLLGGKREIEFTLTERRGPGLAVVALEGAGGGSAILLGTVNPSFLLEANEQCNGSGLRDVRGDGRLVSPGVSG